MRGGEHGRRGRGEGTLAAPQLLLLLLLPLPAVPPARAVPRVGTRRRDRRRLHQRRVGLQHSRL